MNSILAFIRAFQDGLERDYMRAIRLCVAGFAILWLVLAGLLATLSLPIWRREWPDIAIGQLSALTGDVLLAFAYALMPLMIAILLVVLGMWPYSNWTSRQSTQAFVRALLGAVAVRDSAVVDEAALFAAPMQDDQAELTRLDSLAHPLDKPSENWGLARMLLALVFASFWIVIGVSSISLLGHSVIFLGFNDWAYTLYWVISSIMGGVIGAILWRFHHIAQCGFSATVDATGLTFRRARGRPHERRIPWSEARGLARFVYYHRSALPSYVYVLSARDERFIWEEPAVRPDASESARRLAWERRDAARRLAALVERHTNLRLLDLSRAINAAIGGRTLSANGYEWSVAERALSVARSSGDEPLARDLLARLRPAGPFSGAPRGLARFFIWWSARKLGDVERQKLLDLARALLPYYPYPARPDAPIARPLRPTPRFLMAAWLTLRQVILVGLLIVCLFPLANRLAPAVLNPLYSQPLEAALPARVHAETPLYFAALDTPTPGWQTRAATNDDPRSARFTSQGYELTTRQSEQSLHNNIVWNPSLRMPANGAIMVTVTVSPAVVGGDNSPAEVTTAGVLFDGNASGTRGTLFDVDSYGDWTLRRCDNLGSPDPACSDILAMSYGFSFNNGPLAPRPNGATTFHLLLIRQGRTYLLYANGALLAAYHDDTGPAAAGGMMGLYLDEFGQTAQFTNLAVYPVPQGMPFWAW